MLKRMLDILVCPFDKESGLELFELKTNNVDKDLSTDKSNSNLIHKSNKSASLNQDPSNDFSLNTNTQKENNGNFLSSDNNDNNDVVIEEGILFCNTCSRFYPIVDEIPIILPDELRDKGKDIEMLNKWRNSLPDKIIKNASPWHL